MPVIELSRCRRTRTSRVKSLGPVVLLLRAVAPLQVLLEPRRDRQPVDEVHADVPQYGELGEVLEGVHATEARQRMEEADGRRRETDGARPEVVETPVVARRRHRRVDELDDRGAAVRPRLGVEAEHSCNCTRYSSRDINVQSSQKYCI